MPRYWVIAPHEASQPAVYEAAWQYAQQRGRISIGWADLGDVSHLSEADLKERIRATHGDKPSLVSSYFWRFYHGVSEGDLVIARRGTKTIVGAGTVTQTAFYDEASGKAAVGNSPGHNQPNFLGVDWQRPGLGHEITFSKNVLARNTLYEISEKQSHNLLSGTSVVVDHGREQTVSAPIETLAPLLGPLARLIARGAQLGDGPLHTVLLAADVEPSAEALRELRRWGQMLSSLQEDPSEEMRLAVEESLRLRGLPEAPVHLAIAAVVEPVEHNAPAASVSAVPLAADPVSLDFGTLPAGEAASRTIHVEGGPGTVGTGSDQVQVRPERFGPEPTEITVFVRPVLGGLLWTTVNISAPAGTLEIPVVAQWGAAPSPAEPVVPEPRTRDRKNSRRTAANPAEPAAPMQTAAGGSRQETRSKAHRPATPMTQGQDLVVATDGSGTHRSLEEALRAVPSGGTILIRSGVHRLSRGARITTQPVTLLGEGMDVTELVAGDGSYVLRYEGTGLFRLHGLSLRWTGGPRSQAHVVVVAGGETQITECRFSGASARARNWVGAGLMLRGDVTGTVTACEAVNNGHGMSVREQARPTLDGNICCGNLWGISYHDSAGGVVRQNTCLANEHHGIQVGAQAHPDLDANTCRDNKGCGINYQGTAAGAARHNTCLTNEHHGICVAQKARPTLEANTCRENKECGISYEGLAAGTARKNRCVANKWGGIWVGGRAQPTLEDNDCHDNKLSGIGFSEAAAGTARGNTCVGNLSDGIQVAGLARPWVEHNTCRENKGSGLAYVDTASGTARENTCLGNKSFDIYVATEARPVLDGNVGKIGKSVASASAQTRQATAVVRSEAAPGPAEPLVPEPATAGGGGQESGGGKVPAATSMTQGIDLVVATDGSGTHRSLEEALRAAAFGSTIYIRSGVHRLSHGVTISQPVTLLGEGMDVTEVVAGDGNYVLRYEGAGLLRLSGLSLRWSGSPGSQADVAVVASGETQIAECRFSGAATGPGNRAAAGLMLRGDVYGTVTACEAIGNGHGMFIREQAEPTLEGNTCRGNKECGISYEGTAAGTARKNTCVANEASGIGVREQAHPTLEGNTCRENWRGVSYQDAAGGIARQNMCAANRNNGINLWGQARPVVEDNTCRDNKSMGLGYFGAATGTVRGNTCLNNGTFDIYVAAAAKPICDGNVYKTGNGFASESAQARQTPAVARSGAAPNPAQPLAPERTAASGGRQEAGGRKFPPAAWMIQEPDLVVATDGSGTHRSLEEALNAAAAGGVILMRPGVHRLSRGISIEKPVTLLGEGMDATEIVAGDGAYVLSYNGSGLFRLYGLSLRWSGGPFGGQADVAIVARGETQIAECRFSGASARDWHGVGAGLVLRGDVHGTVTACEAMGNEHGMCIREEARPTLQGNTCRENKGCGIHVAGQARPTLRDNTCSANTDNGIAYVEWAGGAIRGNSCAGNSGSGIVVASRARPVVEDNTCSDNKFSGLTYFDGGKGKVRRNTCLNNGRGDIYFGAGAKPVLDGKAKQIANGFIRRFIKP